MKIVLLSSGSPSVDMYPPKGGIQYQIYHTALTLQDLGHEPIIIKRDLRDALPDKLDFRPIRAPFSDEILSRVIYSKRAATLIRKINPDIILTYERFSALFPSLLEYPSIFFTCNCDAMGFFREYAIERHHLNRLLAPVKKRLEERVMRNSSRVAALNTSIESYLHNRGITHTEVIPHGVDLDTYYQSTSEGFIFYAGRLNEVKGVQYLISAFDRISEQFPNIELVIAGEGEERSALEQQSRHLGIADKVRFTGWLNQPELADYFANCTLFVLPSLFETFGIVILEAMASQKPVIASNTMGARNIISHGETGLLFEPRISEQLEEQIQSILEDERYRDTIAANGFELVQKEYAFSEEARQIESLCETVISETQDR